MKKMDSNERLGCFKSNSINIQDARMNRHQVAIKLRKANREEQISKRRIINNKDPSSTDLNLDAKTAVRLSVAEVVAAMKSGELERQFLGIQSARKMLSAGNSPPIDEMIGLGVVPICIQLMSNVSCPRLQFEAAWALSNIASGTSEQTRSIIEQQAVPPFIALLSSEHAYLVEQAVWALSNIAGDSAGSRDLVIQHGVIDNILPLVKNETPLSLLRDIVWLMSNLCCSRNPQPAFDQVQRLLPMLAQLLMCQDFQVLADACWALSYVTDDKEDEDHQKIQAVIETGAVPHLVNLLQLNETSVIGPALRTLGNIVAGTEQQTDVVIAAGALPKLGPLLHHKNSHLVRDAAWTISNITVYSQERIQAVLEAGLFQQIRHVLEMGDFRAQEEAAWVVTSTITYASPKQIEAMIEEYKMLKPFIDLLEAPEPSTIMVVQLGLHKLFDLTKKLGGLENLCRIFEELGGVDKLEALQLHENELVYRGAFEIIGSFFDDEENESDTQETNGALDFNDNQLKAPEGGYKF